MPKIGEIIKGREIGKKPCQTFIWTACIDCKKERWIRLNHGQPLRLLCSSCRQRGERSHHWKGGRCKTYKGYIEIKLQPDDFFFTMASKQRYILEHRLVMAKHLGRCLHLWEIVHHKNGVRDDNRLENLQLVMKGIHNGVVKCPYCKGEFKIR